MNINIALNDLYGGIVHCNRCNACTNSGQPDVLPLCPMYAYDKSFTFSPGGLCFVSRALLEENLDYDQSVADIAFSCAGCGVCTDMCMNVTGVKPYAGPWDVIRTLRHELVKKGVFPKGYLKTLYEGVKNDGDMRDKGEGTRLTLPEKIKDDAADTVLFAECFHVPTQAGIYESAIRLLEKIGAPVNLFADGGCCGSSLNDFGFLDELQGLVEKKWGKMAQITGKDFLFVNPHCQEFVKNGYPGIVPDAKGVKTRHFSEVLLSAIEEGKLVGKKTGKVTVSYHDPCYLGRGLGVYEPPRNVLTGLGGVKLKEMKGNRANSLCCGSRALGKYHPDFSKGTAEKGLRNFKETGAELLITACPYCKQTFRNALPEDEKDRVMDLIEFVDERTEV